MELSGNNRWEFFDSGFLTGQQNMDIDLRLVEQCRETGTAYLRFYRWKPYAISLGYNQNKASYDLYIDHNKCREDNIDIVTRPTGGRAVLHSEELTYSIVMKSKLPVHELYREISSAIIKGLGSLNKKMQGLSFTKETPDLAKLMKTGMYNLCFNSAIKNEINFGGRKLVGSAQRKFGEIVLQHGSILIGNHHKNIVNYLNINSSDRSKMLKELDAKTICLRDIAGEGLTYEDTAHAVFEGFKDTFKIEFKHISRVPGFVSERLESNFSFN